MTSETKKILFSKEEGEDFNSVLRKRVNNYFKENNKSAKGNIYMYLKSIFLIGVVMAMYTVFITFGTTFGSVCALYALLGLCVATCTMNIAHDALHNAYVTQTWGNRILGLTMDLSGASSFYWKYEHTVEHHTFTNIADHDADLSVPFVLRLCPNNKHRYLHRIQHWYAPLLYSMNLIRWIYYSDLKRIYQIITNKHSTPAVPSKSEVALLFIFKMIHVCLFLLAPLLLLPIPAWQVLVGYLGFLAIMGLTLTIVFQLAHIVENVAFPLPNDEGKMENSFSKHQLITTSNFATHNKLVGFLVGGLNFQVEHHLFPHVCHQHLHKIAPIVKATALEFGLPYYENPSFFGAIASHFRTLKKFGIPPQKQTESCNLSGTPIQD